MKYTLFDNYDFDREEIIEEILDSYDMVEGDEPLTREDITDDVIYDWWNDIQDMSYSDAMYILNKVLDGYLIAYGEVGRWDGKYHGANIYRDFSEAWDDLTIDCDYFEITYNDGKINIKCSHHDGTNYYTLAPLTKEGVDMWEDWSYDFNDNRTEVQVKEELIEKYTRYIKEEELC